MYPDFLGIGAQKSGTTWLFNVLERHPQVELPPLKEIHYFDLQKAANRHDYPMQGGRDKNSYYWRVRVHQGAARLKHVAIGSLTGRIDRKHLMWDLRYAFGRRNDRWYARLFEPGAGRISGEITPAYSILRDSHIAQLRDLMPEVKLIYLIRNPVDRNWSSSVNYLDGEPKSFEQIRPLLDRPQARARDDYVGTIDRWLRHFDDEQFFIGTLDEVRSDGAALLARLAAFLDIDPVQFGDDADLFSPVVTGSRSGTGFDMPVEVRRYLSEINLPQLRELARRLGWPATDWLSQAESVLSSKARSA